MKSIKPGRFYWHNGTLFKAYKRTNGCEGCALDSFFVCPNVKTKANKNRPECELNRIIFHKV